MKMTILSHFAFCGPPRPPARGDIMCSNSNPRPPSQIVSHKGFSLLELLAVMAILVLMLALLAPAIKGFTSTAGRKGAINILMNTFEQARAAALESGTNVYVVLWKREFPAQDSIMVLRDPLVWNSNETTLVPLTRWMQLPKGVLLYDPQKVAKNIFKGGVPANFSLARVPTTGSTTLQENDVAILKFAPTGTIQNPSDKDFCRLMIGEGIRGSDGNETLINPNKESALFDVITFRRFTGRASLDVSSLSSL